MRKREIANHSFDKPKPGTFTHYWNTEGGEIQLGCDPVDSIEFLTNINRNWQIKLSKMKVATSQGNGIFIPVIGSWTTFFPPSYAYLTVIEEVKSDCIGQDLVVSIIKFENPSGKIIWKQRCFRRYKKLFA